MFCVCIFLFDELLLLTTLDIIERKTLSCFFALITEEEI